MLFARKEFLLLLILPLDVFRLGKTRVMPPGGPARGEASDAIEGEDWIWCNAGLLVGVGGIIPEFSARGKVIWL